MSKKDIAYFKKKFTGKKAGEFLSFYPKYLENTKFSAWVKHRPLDIIEQFLRGVRLDTIAKIYGVPKSEIAYALRVYGVTSMQRVSGLRKKCMSRALPMACQRSNPAFPYILGVLKGDGSIANDSFQFSSIDFDFFRNVVKHLKMLGFGERDIKIYSGAPRDFKSPSTGKVYTCKPFLRLELYCKKFAELLRMSELNELTSEGRISFVNGFIDSEGSVFKTGKGISIDNSDSNLISFVSGVLSSNNVHNVVHIRNSRGKSIVTGAQLKPMLRISIGKNAYPNFSRTFNLAIGRKRKILNEFTNEFEKRHQIKSLLKWTMEHRTLVENLRTSIEKASS